MPKPKHRGKDIIAQYVRRPEPGENEQRDGGIFFFFGYTVREPAKGFLVGLALWRLCLCLVCRMIDMNDVGGPW